MIKHNVFLRYIADPTRLDDGDIQHQCGLWGRNVPDGLLDRTRQAHVIAAASVPPDAQIKTISQGHLYVFARWTTADVPTGLVPVPTKHGRHKAPTLLDPSLEDRASEASGYFEPYPVYIVNDCLFVSADALIEGEE